MSEPATFLLRAINTEFVRARQLLEQFYFFKNTANQGTQTPSITVYETQTGMNFNKDIYKGYEVSYGRSVLTLQLMWNVKFDVIWISNLACSEASFDIPKSLKYSGVESTNNVHEHIAALLFRCIESWYTKTPYSKKKLAYRVDQIRYLQILHQDRDIYDSSFIQKDNYVDLMSRFDQDVVDNDLLVMVRDYASHVYRNMPVVSTGMLSECKNVKEWFDICARAITANWYIGTIKRRNEAKKLWDSV